MSPVSASANVSSRARYLSLATERDSLSTAAADHDAASAHARSLAKAASAAHQQSTVATRRAAATAAGLNTFNTSHKVKARYIGRKDARSKAEAVLARKADSAKEAADGASEKLDGIRAALKEAQRSANSTEARANRFTEVDREMQTILQRTFEGEERGTAEENDAERALLALGDERTTAVRLFATNAKAAGNVNKALALLVRALQELRTARTAKNADLFLGGGFGLAAGATTQFKLRNATELAAAAEKELAAAKQVQPGLPLRGVQVGVKGGLVLGGLDLVFDNVFSDFYVRQQVQKSYRSVEGAIAAVAEAKKWVDGQAKAWKGHLSVKTREEEEARKRLRGIRDALIRSEEL